MAVLVIITLLSLLSLGFSSQLRIGGMFEEDDINNKLAFILATQLVNEKNVNSEYNLAPVTVRTSRFNTLQVSQLLCSMFQDGIVGIIGSTSPYTSTHVKSICDVKDIPLLQTQWDILNKNDSLVNLYPHPTELIRCFVDLVKAWGWKSFTILYENDDSLYRITGLLKMYDTTGYTITLRQLQPDGNQRKILLEMKHLGEKHYVIDCSLPLLEEVLKQAQQIGIMTEKYNYIIMNLDMATLELSPYQYGGSNITGVRLINPENTNINLIDIAERLQKLRIKNGFEREAFEYLAVWKLKTQTALIIDAVHLLHETLKELRVSPKLDLGPLYCNNTDSWEKGSSIINYMKAKTLKGITGTIKFDTETGVRREFDLAVVELSVGGLIKVGTWSSKEGLNITRVYSKDENNKYSDENPLQNKMFKIITALTPPYGMLKDVTTALSGNDQYEGYGIDLIEELSQMLNFNYTFVIQEDGSNGNYNKRTKKWDGMIGEVVAGRVDFAIADLTISSEREQFVDFTMPFMNLGISILYRKPEPVPPSLFTFASPFSVEVWILLAVAYFLVSLSFFIMGRLCPSEWTNPYPCVEEPQFLINQYSFRNSLWFTIGSLMQQGTEIAPLGISTRMAAGVWWFFTLILVSSYTANLAAFLTIEELVTPFNDVEELVAQPEIKYGAKAKGATYKFFQDSNYSVYPEIRDYMNNNPEYMTSVNEKGIELAERENYAFFMESTTIEYVIERHCNLTQVGGALDEKGYGIAMQKDSKYRHALTEAILQLQESGKLEDLKRRWWKEKRGAGTCEKRQPVATPLDLQNLGGVFFVMGVGTLFGFIGTFIEVGVHTYRTSHKKRLPFKKEVRKEMKFFLKFKEMAKDVHRQEDTSTFGDVPKNLEKK
ncbi:hypothetical protein ILUMI_07378 [Ignelater luminosus]|uniref:Glutamate receptor ionotropic, kainate 2 n=1 Tax=Ignelater luminosus TaxID=2038154 RepID=A0A8K0GI44_IGNLU|nr:hypothetical protein ILUMI_07378 [Ignelater luminosus]